MSSPYPIDDGIKALLASAAPAGVPIAKADFVPALDLKTTPKGFIYFDISDCTPYHSSEGHAEANGLEICNFSLDVACVAHDNTQRKSLATAVLSVLQPVVSGRRTQLTSYTVASTGVFINYIRLVSQDEISSLKTGQSNPDLTMLVLSFSCKATC